MTCMRIQRVRIGEGTKTLVATTTTKKVNLCGIDGFLRYVIVRNSFCVVICSFPVFFCDILKSISLP